ncbi:MAG: class I SAM-dependent methyltransferase [Pseudomonadota bacterium]|nr:class I SAM-dependent methyltransferase [Pseudomonadota bacterium]
MKQNCVICKGNIKRNNDFSFKCINCGFYFSDLKPSFGQDVVGIEDLRRKNFRKLIKTILNKRINPKILEIGSGDGFFVEECIKEGITITGSEASINSLKKLRSKFKIKFLELCLPESIITKTKGVFDVVIFNDVFEHLQDLDNVIVQVKKVLKKNGLIILNLPSSDGVIFRFSEVLMKIGCQRFYNRLWQKEMSSPHLSYFNRKNLKKLFLKHKLYETQCGSLDSLDMKNYRRFRNLFKSFPLALLFTFFCFIIFIFKKILQKDIIFIIFQNSVDQNKK